MKMMVENYPPPVDIPEPHLSIINFTVLDTERVLLGLKPNRQKDQMISVPAY